MLRRRAAVIAVATSAALAGLTPASASIASPLHARPAANPAVIAPLATTSTGYGVHEVTSTTVRRAVARAMGSKPAACWSIGAANSNAGWVRVLFGAYSFTHRSSCHPTDAGTTILTVRSGNWRVASHMGTGYMSPTECRLQYSASTLAQSAPDRVRRDFWAAASQCDQLVRQPVLSKALSTATYAQLVYWQSIAHIYACNQDDFDNAFSLSSVGSLRMFLSVSHVDANRDGVLDLIVAFSCPTASPELASIPQSSTYVYFVDGRSTASRPRLLSGRISIGVTGAIVRTAFRVSGPRRGKLTVSGWGWAATDESMCPSYTIGQQLTWTRSRLVAVTTLTTRYVPSCYYND